MARPQHQSILDELRPPTGRGRPRSYDRAIQLGGVALVLVTLALVISGPLVMSRTWFIGLEAAAVVAGAAYSVFLASHSRVTHVKLERAYSAHLEELSQRLRTMAYRDALTGLYNHRYFYEQLSHEIDRSVRYGQPLTVLLMDMNNFKQINDSYGHIVGDKFLGLVGQIIARQIRASDVGARYGGDEFVVILPNTSADEARITADKLASAVSNAAAMSPGDEKVKLGIAIGVATCPDDSRSPGQLLEIADNRLYEDKATHGRKRRSRAKGVA